jgi:hypothetical protein
MSMSVTQLNCCGLHALPLTVCTGAVGLLSCAFSSISLSLISLLSPWTHNRPSSHFSRLSNDIRNTTRPCDLTLTSCLRQEPRHTLCHTASCSASRAVTHHVFRPVANYRPDNCGSSSRQHFTIYGIRGSTPGWHEPGALSLVTFYLFYGLFLSLAEVLRFYSTYFTYPFVSYLRPTSRTVPAYLVLFTIKSHVH